MIRWGDWFARDFAVLYVVTLLTTQWGWTEGGAAATAGLLLAIMSLTALVTYVPTAKWVDRSAFPTSVHRRHVPALLALSHLPRTAAESLCLAGPAHHGRSRRDVCDQRPP